MLIEVVLAIVAIVISLTAKDFFSIWFNRAESAFRQLGRRRRLAVLIVGVLAITARAAVLPVLPVPVPQVGDDFSHLLLADTLLHGRLANPTPPMWVYFETTDVNMQPTYASVYPPVQGTFLALGRLFTGQPFVGVILSVAIMCAAICWMLQGWMPAEWAFLGGLLAVMRFGVFTYWADGYMGGAPAAIGGALVLGALPRIERNVRSRDAVILGIGLAVLANSRPLEGFLLSVPVGFAFVYWLLKRRGTDFRKALAAIVAPMLVVVVLAGLATGYYFWRVTGNPLRSPYQVNWETYGMMPKFMWQALRPQTEATLRHDSLKDIYYVWEYASYASTRSIPGLLKEWIGRLTFDWMFYLGPILSLPFIAAIASAPYGFRWKQLDSGVRFLFLCIVIVAGDVAAELFSYPHYAAPVTCVVIAFVLIAMRHLRPQIVRGKPFGLTLTQVIPVFSLMVFALRAAAVPLHLPMTSVILPSIYFADRENVPNHVIEMQLEKEPGQHLVIVHYVPGSEDWMGWVHNDADIDHSRIIWAWDMGAEKNRDLVEYYGNRRAWLVTAGDHPTLSPYVSETN
jgi:hypothetical protein